jgi:hypothetical protein
MRGKTVKRIAWLTLPMVMLGAVGAVPIPTLEGCSLWAWAAEIRSYGSDGSDGRDGRSGSSGEGGRSQTTTATGNPANFSLRGADGDDGERGEDGQRPYCGNQPRNVRYDLQAPDGGDGGDGGQGGNGGNGGNLMVYYRDRIALSQLLVDAQGGRGGRGGQGGLGLPGCRCDIRDWDIETCTGTPGQADYVCRRERYVCRDGRYGANGTTGPDGATGQPGQLWLINQVEPLVADNPTQTLSLQEFGRQPVPLSRNLWEARTGANALLAPGSRVNDTYQEYVGRVEGQVSLDWQAEKPASLFADVPLTATIDETGQLTARFTDELWVDYTSHRTADQMTLTVNNVVRASDATRLAWGGTEGIGRNLTAVVLDLAGETAYLDTQFRLTLETTSGDPRDDRRLRYVTRYDEVIPADLVTVDNNRFTLALGRLPIDLGSVSRGTRARITLTAIRSLGENSAEQSISWQGQL